MLELKNVSYSYNTNDIIRDITMTVEPGTFLGILGNNGAGKSTLLKCIGGFLKPRGQIYLDGRINTDFSKRELARTIAYLEQESSYGKLRVIDTVLLGRRPHIKFFPKESDLKICSDAIEHVGISHLKERIMDELSGGERQKVGLARALCQTPKILLLDEPTNNLDIRSQHDILKYIRKWAVDEHKIAITVIHDVNLALRYCNKFMLISDNRCHSYGDYHILDSDSLNDVFGIKAEIFKHGDVKLMDVID